MTEPLMMACVGDISGKVRGKGMPVADLDARIERGIGWTPTNIQITCFDTIADSPYGSLGDLVLWPERSTEVRVGFDANGATEHFILGDVTHTDGAPWACCLRTLLKNALEKFRAATGLRVIATFEHEFMFRGDTPRGGAFSLDGFRQAKDFGETLTAAMRHAGIVPDTFLREYGQGQYEVTMAPTDALGAADQALVLRELVRATAFATGEQVTFTPLLGPDHVGNGVHVHLSFVDEAGAPVTYDRDGKHNLNPIAGAFIAGILRHLEAIVALTAPSAISYRRLVPHRWSAAFNNLGDRDREAAVRICPTSARDDAGLARQFNFEYRAADAAANPHLLLSALVLAGTQGFIDKLSTPDATEEDLSEIPEDILAGRGITRLPASLEVALERLAADDTVQSWFPDGFLDIYSAHKRGELAHVADMSEEELFAAYANAY